MEYLRAEYLALIDRALLGRERAARCIETALSSSYGSVPKYWKAAIQELLEATRAEEVLENPRLAPVLPIIMSIERNDSEALAQHVRTLVLSEPKKWQLWGHLGSYSAINWLMILGVFMFQAYYIAPVFEKMFREFQLRLPLATISIFAISRLLRDNTFLLLFILIGGWLGFGYFKLIAWNFMVNAQDRNPWGWIVSGSAANLRCMSRFLSVFSELTSLQVPLQERSRYSGIASQCQYYSDYSGLLEVYGGRWEEGREIHDPRFPPLLLAAFQQHEDGRAQVNYIRDLALTYAERAEIRHLMRVRRLTPWGIFVAGFVVSYFVISMFMPLISLITSLS